MRLMQILKQPVGEIMRIVNDKARTSGKAAYNKVSYLTKKAGKYIATGALLAGLTFGGIKGYNEYIDYSTRPQPTENAVLFIIDALRNDHLHVSGYERETSPNIDKLAEESNVYENNMSTASMTTTSVPSIFTSHLLLSHYIPENYQSLTTILKNAGYETFGIQTNPWLDKTRGFERGMNHYLLLSTTQGLNEDSEKRNYEDAQVVAQKFKDNILPYINRDKPFFLYVHLMDAHGPYMPKKEFDIFSERDRTLEDEVKLSNDFYSAGYAGKTQKLEELRQSAIDLYDGGIKQADEGIGEIINMLKERGLYDNTLIVVTADHGEGFGKSDDHFRVWHQGLTRGMTNTPLVIKPARGVSKSVHNELTSSLDIAPTILDQLGFNQKWIKKYGLAGRPLNKDYNRKVVRAMYRTGGENDRFYSSLIDAETGFQILYEKYGKQPTTLLYYLPKDRYQQTDLSAKEPKITGELMQRMRIPKNMMNKTQLDKPVTKEQAQQLHALGYLN